MGFAATAFMAVAILFAAFVRGYSGFGFSALVVSAGALVTEPLNFVPVVLFCEFAMTMQQWRSVGAYVDWRRVGYVTLGAAVGVPIGLAILTQIGVNPARALIACYVLTMCAIMSAGWRMRGEAGRGTHLMTGLVSGLANAPSMGGLPVATSFAAQGIPAVTFRATLIVYLAVLDAYTAPIMWWHGLIGRDTFVALALAIPLLAIGVWAGSRHFLRADPQDFHRFTIGLLAFLAVLGLLRSLL